MCNFCYGCKFYAIVQDASISLKDWPSEKSSNCLKWIYNGYEIFEASEQWFYVDV